MALAVITINTASAQQDITGVYNRSSNDPHGASYLYILADHKFAITFFGGVIAGDWNIKGDEVEFKPCVNEQHFLIYGRHNPNIKDSSRVYFQGFDDQETFIGFGAKKGDQPLLKKVFNSSPNCVPYPSVAKFKGMLGQISFTDQPFVGHGEESDPQVKRNIYTFANTEKYNDFVAYYLKDDSDKRPFYAKIKANKLYFDEREAAAKKPLPTTGEDIEFISQIVNLPKTTAKVFYNPFYNRSNADVNDLNNWKFNEKKNAFINFLNYQEGEENKPKEQDAYNKMNIIYQFNNLPLSNKVIQPFAIDYKPLFVATCN